jgi:hypothetical protein
MNDERADSAFSFKPKGAGLAAPEPRAGGRWPFRRWLALITLVFAAHVVLISIFGAKRSAVPGGSMRQGGVPQLTLADNSSELIALDDPTLFALPHGNDFAAFDVLASNRPAFRWTGPHGELASPAAENLGAVFNRFMETNQFAGFQPDFKPEPELSEPGLPFATVSVLPQSSTLRITGDLAQRRLRDEIPIPSLPWNGVLAPSRVQVLVDAAGDVISEVLLPPSAMQETTVRPAVGDKKALQIARALRFSPATLPTFGELVFDWLTVPLAATNAP